MTTKSGGTTQLPHIAPHISRIRHSLRHSTILRKRIAASEIPQRRVSRWNAFRNEKLCLIRSTNCAARCSGHRTQPNAHRILTNIGRRYLKDGNYQKAVWEYQKALAMNPQLAPAYNGIGIAYTMLEKYSEAIDAQQKALALQPDFVEAHAGLGLAYLKQNRAEPAPKTLPSSGLHWIPNF